MISERQQRWDRDYLALAAFWAQRKSKDPSSQVGAVIVDPWNNVVGLGYNGFPKGVDDSPERYENREVKYEFVVHAEPNAILSASGKNLHGATIYTWPFPTCNDCAKLIIQSGIRRVVSLRPTPEVRERWGPSLEVAEIMYLEAGVKLEYCNALDD